MKYYINKTRKASYTIFFVPEWTEEIIRPVSVTKEVCVRFYVQSLSSTKFLNDSLENIFLLVPMNSSGNHRASLLTEKRVNITYLGVFQQNSNPGNGWNVRHHLATAVHLVLLTVFSTEKKCLIIRYSVGATHYSGQLYRLSSKKYTHRKHSYHGHLKFSHKKHLSTSFQLRSM